MRLKMRTITRRTIITITKLGIPLLVLLLTEAPSTLAFHQSTSFRVRRQGRALHQDHPQQFRSILLYNSNRQQQQDQEQEIIPETSFGAEAVPEGQRPVNEYLDITRQPLFGWASTDNQGLLTRLAIVYAVSFVTVCWPIAGATYTQDGFVLQKLTAANVGALSLIGFLLLRLYTGWSYVGDRLTAKVIEYEETGWYDGDFEYKTEAEQKRDKFLWQEKVKPVVQRLQAVSLAVAGLWVASVIGFNVAASQKPIFDEYDPAMLERLRYDDNLAEKAAMSSGGKPIYCDNRYYRAVAGGGQGCRSGL